MEHFHANWTASDQSDALFATKREAREYLATDFAKSAVYFINDDFDYDIGDRSLVWESFEMARAILTGDGAPLSWDDGPILDGRAWQEPTCGEFYWFERCEKTDCGPLDVAQSVRLLTSTPAS